MPPAKPKSARSLEKKRNELAADIGPDYCRSLAEAYDTYFQNRIRELPPRRTPYALVAVGGYGRSEMCPRSDIDVLVLYDKWSVPAEAKALAQDVFFPLWDLGADLGHGVRIIGDCLSLAKEDWQVFASLIDSRFVAGDRAVFESFIVKRDKKLFPKRLEPFRKWLAEHNLKRAASYGDAAGMLEPNLKEALGGLRDVHQIRWLNALLRLSGGGLPQDWLDVLESHLRFLLVVRNHLHILAGRKEDRLSLDAQRKLAGSLGFEAREGMLDVEVFLTELHRVMAEIRTQHHALWPMLASGAALAAAGKPLSGDIVLTRQGLAFADNALERAKPEDTLDIFGHALRLGEPLSLSARRSIEAGIADLESFSATEEGGKRGFHLLVKALMEPHGEAALSDMLETGVLGAIIPEFGRVQHMVQYDVFHIHPVGRHTLETLLEIRKTATPGHQYHEVYARLEHPERLLLGALFHDIGKGQGGAHSEKGAEMAADALARLGLDEEAISDVVFLVLRHLLLADTAIRRDISDRDVLAACAQRIGTRDRLDMLLVLTMADSVATGPSAWNDWKASLLEGLHARIQSVLEGGALFGASDAHAMLVLRDKLRAKARGLFSLERLEGYLDAMPPRYLLSRRASDIMSDLRLLSQLEEALEEDARMRPSSKAGKGVCILETSPSPAGDGWSVTLVAKHQPGLFATVAGVLALHGVNIRSADFFRWDDSTEIHTYQTANPPDTLFVDELWARVRRAVHYALNGKLSLDYRIQEKRASPLLVKAPDMGIRPGVLVDNDSSEYFTAVEVKAADRLGLLYDIAVALDSLGLDVHMAKIDTQGFEVYDVFYVRGDKGRKVTEPGRVEELSRMVLSSLA